MANDVKAQIKKKQEELRVLNATLDRLNSHRLQTANDILKCLGAIEVLKELEGKKAPETKTG